MAAVNPCWRCYQRHKASWLIGLLEDFKLLLSGPAPAELNTDDHFQPVRSYEDIVIYIVLFLILSLRNTDGTVIKGLTH
jgi:hypothetical protein